jgi:uncharacterized membrane protein
MTSTDDEPPKLESEPESKNKDSKVVAEITAQVTSQVIMQVSKFFSGPLPPPDLLADYNNAFSGAAERIVAMAESQLKHRQSIEMKVVDSNCWNESAGLVVGSSIAVLALLVCAYLIVHDKSLQGFGVILTAIGALAGTFIYSRHAQSKERAKKLTPIQQAMGGASPPSPRFPIPK